MTKAEAFGRWLAQHPRRARSIAWAVLILLLVVSTVGIWLSFTTGKEFRLLIPAVVAICVGLRFYRQAQKARSS
jgi:type II secretory pathway component PulM